MKLHKDGTLEGTPEELAEFMRLKDPMFGKMSLPLETTGVFDGTYPDCDFIKPVFAHEYALADAKRMGIIKE